MDERTKQIIENAEKYLEESARRNRATLDSGQGADPAPRTIFDFAFASRQQLKTQMRGRLFGKGE